MTWEEYKKKKEGEKVQALTPMKQFQERVKENVSSSKGRVTTSDDNTNNGIFKKIGDTAQNLYNNSALKKNNDRKRQYSIPSSKDSIYNRNNISRLIPPAVTKEKKTWGDTLQAGANKVGNAVKEFHEATPQEKINDAILFGKTVGTEATNFGIKSARQIEQLSYTRSGFKEMRDRQNVIQDKIENKPTKFVDENGNIRYAPIQNRTLNKLNDMIQEKNEKIQQYQDEASNPISKKILELTPSMTDSVMGMGLNAVAPGMGSSMQFLSFSSDYYDDAKNRGMTDQEALTYSGIMGAMESVTEKIGGDLTENVGKAVLKNSGKGTIKQTGKEVLKAYGLDIAENFIEEAVMEPIQEVVAQKVGGDDKANFENMTQRMLQSGIDGGLTSVLMGGASVGVSSAVKLVQKIQNGEQVTQDELKTTFEDIKNNGVDTQQLFEQGAKENVNSLSQKLNNGQNEQLLSNSEQVTLNQNENVSNSNLNPTEIINNSNLNDGQKNKLSEMTQKYNLSSADVQDLINGFEEKKNSYKYEKSDNEKINYFRQDMAKYYDNSEDNHNFANVVEKIITDKNYKVRLDDSIVNGEGKIVNAQISNVDGNIEIKINPNSKRAGEILLMHEVTHSIETDKMKSLVIDYASKNSEFNEALESLKQNYGTEDVSDEVLADISGNLFGNQEFISELSTKEPSVFRKIYNKIIEIANKLTGNSKESLFIRDLKNKWEEAYRKNGSIEQTKESRKLNGYNPDVSVSIDSISEYAINNYNNKNEVAKKVIQKLKDSYLSTEQQSKPITNIDTGMEIEIRGNGIRETFGNDKYYKNLPLELKKAKIATMQSLAKLIKYGEIRSPESGNYHDPNSQVRYAYLNSPIIIDGVQYNVNMDIRKSPNGENRFYIHSLQISNGANSLSSQSGLLMNESAPNTSIASNKNNVNTTKYSMQNVENDSNQFKSIDNINPTDNPDIRYSQNSNKWQEFVDKNFKQSGTRTDLTKNRKGTVNEVKVSEKAEGKTLRNKAQQAINRSKKSFINRVVDNFQTSIYSNKEVLNDVMNDLVSEIEKNGSVSREVADSKFNELYEKLVKTDTNFYDTYKDVKNSVRKTKIYVSDSIKNSIADFNDFRRGNMGNLILTNDKNALSVDSLYQELSSKNPELFPDNIINPSEQLERISEVQKDIVKVETNVKAYVDKNLGQDYKDWARNDFNKILDKFTSEINFAFRYNNDVKQNAESYKAAEIKETYSHLKELRNEYEKAMSKAMLTNEDRRQLDRLIKGDITLEELPKSVNKAEINKVYQSAFEYKTIQNAIKEYKTDIKQQKMEKAKKVMGDLNTWNDKKVAFLYQRETARRNIQDIAPKEVADKVNKEYIEKYYNNEADRTRKINDYTDKINSLKLRTEKKYEVTYKTQERKGTEIIDVNKTEKVSEAELVQIYGENRISLKDLRESGANVERIQNAVDTFKTVYKDVIKNVNDVLVQNGYEPVNVRNDYFPHYQEGEESFTKKVAKMVGIDLTGEDLPTEIAGRTQNFKPGKKYVANFNERKTNITDFNVLKAFDTYIRNTTDVIYHTEDITNMRALSSAIREFYTSDEIKNQIKEIEESTASLEEKTDKINEIKERTLKKSNLSNFINWFDNYINILAGKKTEQDRIMEKHQLGRKAYQLLSKAESRVASNMVGMNINVALSNFGVLAQSMGELNPVELGRGIAGTLWANGKSVLGKADNSFASESNFLTNRRGADVTYSTLLDKITAPVNNTLNLVDDVVTESITRAMYIKNLKEGMTQQEALNKADIYTSGLVGDRTKGMLPTIFENKNPLSKLATLFQVEVNNQYSHFFKDLPRDLNSKKKVVTGLTSIAIASHMMNLVMGRTLLPDPIGIVEQLFKGLANDDDDDDWETIVGTTEDILSVMPFSNIPALFLSNVMDIDLDNVGRIPVAGAIPDIGKAIKTTMNKNYSKEYKKQVWGNEIKKPLFNFILPTGGAQLKKTVEGVKTMVDGGSYTVDSKTGEKKLQFEAKDLSVGDKIKAATLGKYTLPSAKDYIDNDFKSYTVEQTKLHDESKIDYKVLNDYFKYEKEISDSDVESNIKKNKKAEKINSMRLSDNQKYDLYKYSLISDSKQDDVEYMINNGTSKSEFMKEYTKATKRGIELPDEEEYKKLKSAGLGLENYVDFKADLKLETNNKRLFTGKDSATLSDKEKINILNKSNYSDSVKEGLYLEYVANDSNKEIYENLKLINGKNSINAYFTWLSADKKADREDDGTINGKAISGSAKEKTVNVIESLELNSMAKLYLHATKYDLSTKAELANYNKIKEYIYSLPEYEKREKIIKTLKGSQQRKIDEEWEY